MTPGAVKGPDAFRTISEASSELGVPQHMLRFWETKFAFIRPMKRAGGRRFYRPQDLDVLRGVRTLLQEEGYTIKGVQRLHKEGGVRRLVAASGVSGAGAEALARELEATATAGSGLDGGTPEMFSEGEPSARDAKIVRGGEAGVGSVSHPVLDPAARARLVIVLGDLERTKGVIDALLRG